MNSAILSCAAALLLCSCTFYEGLDRSGTGPARRLSSQSADRPVLRPIAEDAAPPPLTLPASTAPAEDEPLLVPGIGRSKPSPLEQVANVQQRGDSSRYVPPTTKPADAPTQGTWVIDRRGQLAASSEGGWLFVFDQSAHEKQSLPPMKLLPCGLLAGMEEAVARRARPDVYFRISGEVTQYKGQSFLLIRQAVEEAELRELTTQPTTGGGR